MYKKVVKKRIDFNSYTIKSALEEQLYLTENGICELSFLMNSFFYEGGYSAMWHAFTAKAQNEFLTYFYSLMVGYALRIPPINGRFLIELYNKNFLEERSGLQHISYDENCQRFNLHFLGGNCIKAKYIINATGNGKKLAAHYDEFPLGKKLIENGIIVSSPWGGIKTVGQSRVVEGRDGKEQTNFFCIGPLGEAGKKPNTYGALFSCIAGQEIFDTLFPPLSSEVRCTSLDIR